MDQPAKTDIPPEIQKLITLSKKHVEQDKLAFFASEENVLIFMHFWQKGYEYAMGLHQEEICTRKGPGLSIRTYDGKIGRTFHAVKPIDGKLPVYLRTKDGKNYCAKATLYKRDKIKVIGYLD